MSSNDNSDTFRSGFVSLYGRPNTGKSTLLNKILRTKVSITSNKAQTTRHQVRGVLDVDDAQVVFVDTPGVGKPRPVTVVEARTVRPPVMQSGYHLVQALRQVRTHTASAYYTR